MTLYSILDSENTHFFIDVDINLQILIKIIKIDRLFLNIKYILNIYHLEFCMISNLF